LSRACLGKNDDTFAVVNSGLKTAFSYLRAAALTGGPGGGGGGGGSAHGTKKPPAATIASQAAAMSLGGYSGWAVPFASSRMRAVMAATFAV
jgi:hypothetical protein